tara:strand:+ start:601 stop:915 length:315 start_codon:yes stop_codon:yes gene_type:complete
MNIEFKEITLSSTDVLNSLKYPNAGFFLVRQPDLVQADVLIYNDGNLVWFMLNLRDIIDLNSFKETKEPKLEMEGDTNSSGSVSEELFLKAMSLMVNKNESYKQ